MGVYWGTFRLSNTVALSFLSLIQWAGRGNTFWIYGLISIGTWIFVYQLVPETKGRSLESIEKHWTNVSQSRQNATPPDQGPTP